MLNKVIFTVVFWSLSCLIPAFSPASGLSVVSELAPMNVPRYNAGSAQYDGKIYVFGGLDANKTVLDSAEVYDPAQDTWTEVSPLPTARAASCAEVIGDTIYVIGGSQGAWQQNLTTNAVYDPNTDTWTEAAPMLTGRGGAASFVYDGKIFIVGGATTTYQPTVAVEVFDPQTNTWSTGAPMPTARGALTSIAEYQQEFYVLSGYLSSDTYTKAFEKYNPETDSWTVLDDTPYGFRQAETFALKDVIYCLGGCGKNDSPNQWPELLLYDISNSTWQSAGLSGFQKRENASSELIGNTLYVLGGRSPDNTIPANQLLKINQPATDTVVLADANSVKSMDLETHAILWESDLPEASTEYFCFVLADGQGGLNVIVTDRNGYTACFNGQTGNELWAKEGFVFRESYAAEFLHKRVYEEGSIFYPDGPPNMGGGPAPDILLGDNAGSIQLIDGLSGELIWEHTGAAPYDLIRPSHFLPDINGDGVYDILITDKSNGTYCLNGANGTGILWERQDLTRGGDPVPDITGDGLYDVVVNDCCWTDAIIMLDGKTGATLWSEQYGSFDLHYGLPVQDELGIGLIQSAQLASGGGTRRYTASNGEIVWELPSTYSDMASCGLLQGTAGFNHVALWRHQDRYVCMNGQNGTVLWDSIPCEGSQRFGIIAVPNCTGDGNEDVLTLDNGIPKLYDGLTGSFLANLPVSQISDCAFLPASKTTGYESLDLTATPSMGEAPLEVAFTLSDINATAIESYAWDFDGDGTTDSTDPAPLTHTYTSNGTYAPTLSISTVSGQTYDLATSIQVNQPQAEIEASTVITGGTNATRYAPEAGEAYEIPILVQPDSQTVEVDRRDYTYNLISNATVNGSVLLDVRRINWTHAKEYNEVEQALLEGMTKTVPHPLSSWDRYAGPNGQDIPAASLLVDLLALGQDITVAVTPYTNLHQVPAARQLLQEGYLLLSGADVKIEDNAGKYLNWEDIAAGTDLGVKISAQTGLLSACQASASELSLFVFDKATKTWTEQSGTTILEDKGSYLLGNYGVNRLSPYVFAYKPVPPGKSGRILARVTDDNGTVVENAALGLYTAQGIPVTPTSSTDAFGFTELGFSLAENATAWYQLKALHPSKLEQGAEYSIEIPAGQDQAIPVDFSAMQLNDADQDGVVDQWDACPDTPQDAVITSDGCLYVCNGTTPLPDLVAGWNLVGWGQETISTDDLLLQLTDQGHDVVSCWKWQDANWQTFVAGYTPAQLEDYCNTMGFDVLQELAPGEGFWVNCQ